MASNALRFGRHSQVGCFYTLTTVTLHRQPVFTNPHHALATIEAMRHVERTAATWSLAWVVMPDHLHWLLELRNGSLARCMQMMKSRSSRAIGRCNGGDGSVWQPGYYDHALRRDDDVQQQARYILANPVRAGLATQEGQYPFAWSRWPEG